jgi:HicB family
MDLSPYIDAVRDQLAATAETAGPQARELAERLAASLESATRLALLDALSTAASEITRDLAPGSVDVRLRGREPTFVVSLPPAEAAADDDLPSWPAEPAPPPAAEGDEPNLTRINLRLNQELKDRVEEAARRSGLSVNAWLVRAAAGALEPSRGARTGSRTPRGGERFTGWVR